MTRVAIAMWRGCVSTTLDFASTLLLIDVENGKGIARKEICLGSSPPQRIALRLEELGIEVVICGAISRCLAQDLETREMRVIPFVRGEVDEVFQAYLNGILDDSKFLMAGCLPDARRAWRCQRGRGHSRKA